MKKKKIINNKYLIVNSTSGFTFLKKKQTGFTLVELLIYMGLLTIMVLIFTDIFTSIIDNQLGSENTSNVADDGRYIYSRFIYDVNRADSIVSPGVQQLRALTKSETVRSSIHTVSETK